MVGVASTTASTLATAVGSAPAMFMTPADAATTTTRVDVASLPFLRRPLMERALSTTPRKNLLHHRRTRTSWMRTAWMRRMKTTLGPCLLRLLALLDQSLRLQDG